MTEITEAYDWQERTIVGSDGEKIGKVDEVYLDDRSGKPEWATVKSGLFGSKSNFVPLASATTSGEDVSVQVTKDQVKEAPGVEADGELSQEEERKLFEHYNVPYTDEGSVTAKGAPQGRPTSTGRDTDEAMTRSEEELRVGTRSVETGRVRLRKYVVTEMVTKTVPVQHEEVRIEREPITDANRDAALNGPEISEAEHEVVLHEDQVVVDKEVVAKERVKLGKETVSETETVGGEVRKEEIELDGTDATSTGRTNRN